MIPRPVSGQWRVAYEPTPAVSDAKVRTMRSGSGHLVLLHGVGFPGPGPGACAFVCREVAFSPHLCFLLRASGGGLRVCGPTPPAFKHLALERCVAVRTFRVLVSGPGRPTPNVGHMCYGF